MSDTAMLTPSTEYRLLLEDTDFRLLIENLDDVQPETDNVHSGLHSHGFSELFVCVSGTVSLMTETGLIELHDGEAAVVLPGVMHLMREAKRKTEWYTVSFSGTHRHVRDCGGLYRKLRLFFEGDCIFTVYGFPELAADIRRIDREFHRGNTLQPPLLLASLLLHMEESSIMTRIPISSDRMPVSGEIHRLMIIDEIIDDRFAEDWNAKRIAGALHISSRQVDRIAQKRYGKSFRQAIMDNRCQKAAHLLSTTKMTTAEIMNASGFCSVKSLYREFRQRYGMTPTEYRKRAAGKKTEAASLSENGS